MALEERVQAEPCAGSLSACLVDGNAEQNARERKSKRRALVVSVSLQTIGLTALVIAPLLAKPAELAMRTAPPMPIYRSVPKPVTVAQPPQGPIRRFCFDCIHNPPSIGHAVQTPPSTLPGDPGPDFPIGPPTPSGAIPGAETRQPPPPEVKGPPERKIIHEPHINPAMLVRQVKPVYPPLAIQTRRNGKVELHALIGTDGTVQSLELVSGDPLFVQSALDAVRQWRYRPTMLNGQAVGVDTYITVIYTLQP